MYKRPRYLNPKLQLLPVDKGIPIPEPEYHPMWKPEQKYLYGLERLDVGDSILIPGKGRIPTKNLSDVKRRLGWLFTYRVQKDYNGEQTGIRVWRVA